MKKFGLILGLLIVLGTPVMAVDCDATVQKIVKPREVQAGQRVPIEATVELSAEGYHHEECEFLLEGNIKPRRFGYKFSLTETRESECCPKNDNYASKRYTVDAEESGATKTVTLEFDVVAPEEGMIDSCPPDDESPETFWEGEGWYDVQVGAYNGCSEDVEEFQVYDSETEEIYIESESGENGGDEPELDVMMVVVAVLVFMVIVVTGYLIYEKM